MDLLDQIFLTRCITSFHQALWLAIFVQNEFSDGVEQLCQSEHMQMVLYYMIHSQM